MNKKTKKTAMFQNLLESLPRRMELIITLLFCYNYPTVLEWEHMDVIVTWPYSFDHATNIALDIVMWI